MSDWRSEHPLPWGHESEQALTGETDEQQAPESEESPNGARQPAAGEQPPADGEQSPTASGGDRNAAAGEDEPHDPGPDELARPQDDPFAAVAPPAPVADLGAAGDVYAPSSEIGLAAQAAELFAAQATPAQPGDVADAAAQPEPVETRSLIEQALERRRDPRDRPPDPAGTQPKYDEDSLLPQPADDVPVVAYATEISEGEEESDLLPARRSAGGVGTPLPASTPPAETFAPRFQFIKGALGAIGVVAVAIVVLALTGSTGHSSGSKWSAWKPVDNGVDPAVQIANHVAPEYRQDGKQIVDVTGGPPAYNGQSLVLALLESGKQPSELNGNAVLYQLCGRGSNCSISGGTPSAERGLLLRREALELALYTFHYLPGVSEVVVTIPPAPKASTGAKGTSGTSTTASSGPNRALFFRPTTVGPELSKSLGNILPQPTPNVVGMNASRNAALVAAVTGKALYDFSIVQGDSTYVLVLQPPGLGG